MATIMFRPRRSVAAFCVAVIVLAAFLPGVSVVGYATFEPQWILLPDEVVVALDLPVVRQTADADDSLVASRGPPSLSLA